MSINNDRKRGIVPLISALVLAFSGLAAAQENPQYKGSVHSPDFDFELRLPTGWRELKRMEPIIFRIGSPEKEDPARGITDDIILPRGMIWMEYRDAKTPKVLDQLIEEFKAKAPKDYPEYKEVLFRKSEIAGYPAFTVVFTTKPKDLPEMAFVHTVIQRQLMEFLALDAACEVAGKDKAMAIMDKVAATIKTGLPPGTENAAALQRGSEVRAAAAVRPEFAGEQWHYVKIGKTQVGHQRTLVREELVDGRKGYAFEIEIHLENAAGDKNTQIARGSFTPDGSYQKGDSEETLEIKDQPKQVFRESVVVVKNEATATREFSGSKVTKTFKVPEGTLLADVVETFRRHVVLAKPGLYALPVLAPYRDRTFIETIEVNPVTKIRTPQGEEDMIIALVRSGKFDSLLEYQFDVRGGLFQRSSALDPRMMRRCTKEEALKK